MNSVYIKERFLIIGKFKLKGKKIIIATRK
jgi:hypothetical protein